MDLLLTLSGLKNSPTILAGRSILLSGQVGLQGTLANIADILGCMAGPAGGLRSGHAANTIWSKAFQLLGVGL